MNQHTTSNEKTERDLFEVEMRSIYDLTRCTDGDYAGTAAHAAWNGWQAARAGLPPPSVEPVAWVRRHPDGALTAEFLEDAAIEPVRKNSGAWVALYAHPAAASPPIQVAPSGGPTYMDAPGAEDDCVTIPRSNYLAMLEALSRIAENDSDDQSPSKTAARALRLVPAEATEAMMHAAEDVPAPRPYGAVYRAMLAAAPVPQVAPEQATPREVVGKQAGADPGDFGVPAQWAAHAHRYAQWWGAQEQASVRSAALRYKIAAIPCELPLLDERAMDEHEATMYSMGHKDAIGQAIRALISKEAAPSADSAAVARDAARYRWLRNPDPQPSRPLDVCDDCINIVDGSNLDAEIDAAMQPTTGKDT